MMKQALVVATLGLALSACGGGGGGGTSFKDPDKVNFTYGSATTPSADEAAAADVGSGGAQDTLAFVDATGDAAMTQGQDLAGQPMSIAEGILPGDYTLPASRAVALGQARLSRRAIALLSANATAATTGWDDPGCWTLTADALTFDHCTETVSETDASGQLTVTGAFHRAAGHVYWDATMSADVTLSDPAGNVSIRVSEHVSGDVTFSTVDQTIVGFSRVDASAAMSGQGHSESLAVTFNVDYDLGYTTTPSTCVDTGTLTVKRLWAQVPSDTSDNPDAYTDASVRFTWSGCGVVTVARSW